MPPGCSLLLISPAQALLQTDKPVAPDNNVIHQVNIEKFRGLHQLFSHSDILWRRRWISTRMIVRDHPSMASLYLPMLQNDQEQQAAFLVCSQHRQSRT